MKRLNSISLSEMIGEVLKKFEIYLHQLTSNAIVRLNIYIWALRSQGKSANAEGFCQIHKLHYQTKARAAAYTRTSVAITSHTKRTQRPCERLPHQMTDRVDERVVLRES
jgi:hypothetical protein